MQQMTANPERAGQPAGATAVIHVPLAHQRANLVSNSLQVVCVQHKSVLKKFLHRLIETAPTMDG